MYLLLKMVVVHCYVSLPYGNMTMTMIIMINDTGVICYTLLPIVMEVGHGFLMVHFHDGGRVQVVEQKNLQLTPVDIALY